MTVIEHPYPCLVVSCDQCGLCTWPVEHSPAAAKQRALSEFGFVFMKDGKSYCRECARKRRKKS